MPNQNVNMAVWEIEVFVTPQKAFCLTNYLGKMHVGPLCEMHGCSHPESSVLHFLLLMWRICENNVFCPFGCFRLFMRNVSIFLSCIKHKNFVFWSRIVLCKISTYLSRLSFVNPVFFSSATVLNTHWPVVWFMYAFWCQKQAIAHSHCLCLGTTTHSIEKQRRHNTSQFAQHLQDAPL